MKKTKTDEADSSIILRTGRWSSWTKIIGMRKETERKSKSLRFDPRQTFYFRVFLFSYSLRCYTRDALENELQVKWTMSLPMSGKGLRGPVMDERRRNRWVFDSILDKLSFVSLFSRSYPPRGAKKPSEPLAFIRNWLRIEYVYSLACVVCLKQDKCYLNLSCMIDLCLEYYFTI